MAFENLVLGIDFLDEPTFLSGSLKDINPLSGVQTRRHLDKPNDAMRVIHHRLQTYLRHLSIEQPYATGCLPNCSPRKNVAIHRKNRFFYLIDLRRAYRSVKVTKLAKVLCEADPSLNGQRKEVKAFLEKYCMSRFGGLATGAPASPDLFNLYCLYLIDKPLEMLLSENNLTYTRYLDDLTFSASEPITRKQRRAIREVIQKAGFDVHHLKSEVSDLQKGPIFINGIGLELGGRIFVPRDFINFLRGLIHKGLRGQFELWPQIEGGMSVFKGIIKGRKLNQTEAEILGKYKEFRRLLSK